MPRDRDLRFRPVTAFQRWVANPVSRRLPFQTLVETTGRTSGPARRTAVGGRRWADGGGRTAVGGRRIGREFWFVSEYGDRSQYVRNIRADPRVRVRVGGRWHHGTAHLLPEDDPRARLKSLPRLNSGAVRAFGTDLLTIRVDLDPGAAD